MDTLPWLRRWFWVVAFLALGVSARAGVAEEGRSAGLRAYWSTSVGHAEKLGHVDWERYDRTSTVSAIDFPVTSEGFYTDGPTDWFALRLVGEIDVPETGTWTFTLSSDEGARLWIDGELVVNDGLAHSYRARDGVVWLEAGAHAIEVRYLERRYSAGLALEWSGPTRAREVVPAEAFWSPVEEPTFEGGEGLWVGWVHGLTHATNVGQVDWGSHDRIELAERIAFPITGGAFELGGPEDYFGANLVGQIEIEEEGSWTFELGSDESAMLLIDGAVVVADASGHSFRWKSGSVTLTEGLHRIEVRYLERRYSAGLFVAWRGPSDAHTSIIPSSAFSPGAGVASPTPGEGLRAYWSEGVSYAQTVGQIEWADAGSVTGVSQVYWASTGGAFLDGGATDYFAVRLVARVSVPRSGTWLFNLGSDESARLYIDDRLVVDDASGHSFRWKSGTVSLSAGEHDIEVRYLERRYSAGLVLTWKGPGDLVEQVIPRSAFSLREEDPSMGEGGSGLRASWLTNVSHATNVGQVDWTESDSTTIEPNVSWASTGEAFYEGGPTDYFALRLTGTMTLESGGAWTFGLGSDESARLYIDGELVINDDAGHSFRWKSREIELEAGEHAIEVQYLERRYSAGLVLTWTPPGGIETVVPASAFSHPANDSPYDPGSGGVHAYWSQGLSHATKVGQVDWDQHDSRTVEDNLSWRLTGGAFKEGGATDYFAVRLLSRLNVPADGVWTFGLGSDESALLFIDGEPVVIDAAGHSFRWKEGSVTLEAGAHDLEVWYLERRYSAGLSVTWRGPTIPAEEVIRPSALSAPETEAPFEPGGGLRAFWSTGVSHATNVGQVDWAEHDAASVVQKVSWPISSGAFYTGGPTDYFGVRLSGLIEIPETGTWTFGLGSDESAQLLIDGRSVVADPLGHSFRWKEGSVELEAGWHAIEVRYLERRYSAGLVLTWLGPGVPFDTVIPASAFSMHESEPVFDPGEPGIEARWVDGLTYVGTFDGIEFGLASRRTTEARISWKSTGSSFVEGGAADNFGARFRATLTVPEPGTWTFRVGSDEAALLTIDDSVVVEDLSNHSFRWKAGQVTLEAGEHDLELYFFERRYSAGLFLTWQAPGAPVEEVIPASAFSGGARTGVRVVRWSEVGVVDDP